MNKGAAQYGPRLRAAPLPLCQARGPFSDLIIGMRGTRIGWLVSWLDNGVTSLPDAEVVISPHIVDFKEGF